MTTRDEGPLLRFARVLVLSVLAALALSACGEDTAEPAPPLVAGGLGQSRRRRPPRRRNPCPPRRRSDPPTTAPSPAVTTAVPTPSVAASEVLAAVDAANAFLDALAKDQRSQLPCFAFDSPLRPNWSNLPPGMTRFERNGVRIGDLDAVQTALMHEFLRVALSPDGYAKVVGIVGAEDALAATSSRQLSADNYWLAFFGEPSLESPWGWQFGGHHLAVNVTVIDGRSYLSPTLVAIQPATYEAEGVTVTPLGRRGAGRAGADERPGRRAAGGGAGAAPQ